MGSSSGPAVGSAVVLTLLKSRALATAGRDLVLVWLRMSSRRRKELKGLLLVVRSDKFWQGRRPRRGVVSGGIGRSKRFPFLWQRTNTGRGRSCCWGGWAPPLPQQHPKGTGWDPQHLGVLCTGAPCNVLPGGRSRWGSFRAQLGQHRLRLLRGWKEMEVTARICSFPGGCC